MKTIGLLGGTSWPSTIEYYRLLNRMAQERLGGHHSARLILYNIDYHEIKSRYHEGWDEIPDLLRSELERLCRLEPDCLLICNNTLHKAFDRIAEAGSPGVPVFHIVGAVGRAARRQGMERVLLLGTRFTMEDGYYADRLQSFDLRVDVPSLEERKEIQRIQSALSKGEQKKSFRTYFEALLQRYAGADAAVLGCTELPLAIDAASSPMALLNPIELQCKAAFDYAVDEYDAVSGMEA